MAELLGSPDERGRVLACDVLAQLGYDDRDEAGDLPFREETIPLLIACTRERSAALVESALTGLGHQRLGKHASEVVSLADHESDEVRFALSAELFDARRSSGGRSARPRVPTNVIAQAGMRTSSSG